MPLRTAFTSYGVLAIVGATLLLHRDALAQAELSDLSQAEDCVVLLHGLARTARSMRPVQKALVREGFVVRNIDYDSRAATIDVLAMETLPRAVAECEREQPRQIHVVTHSLGGILLRYYLSERQIDKLGHVVMLAPPNQGSEVVDKWRNRPGFRQLNGPAGLQLGTDAESVPRQLGAVEFSLGVIAGTATVNPILSLSLPNPDDGKVSVASTKVVGMTDFVAVPYSHTFIMRRTKVHRQIVHFLRHGRFAAIE